MIERSAFHQLFRPVVLEADAETLKLSLKAHMSDTLERQPGTGQWHGGAVSALVDTAGCYALALLAGEPAAQASQLGAQGQERGRRCDGGGSGNSYHGGIGHVAAHADTTPGAPAAKGV